MVDADFLKVFCVYNPKINAIMWQLYAILSAVFASLTAVFAKVGVNQINSNLATAIRTLVILFMVWGVVLYSSDFREIKGVSGRALLFLTLSGLATGVSWLCYFKALQIGEASKVAPVDKLSVVFTIILAGIFLGEPISPKVLLGAGLILGGSLVMMS